MEGKEGEERVEGAIGGGEGEKEVNKQNRMYVEGVEEGGEGGKEVEKQGKIDLLKGRERREGE